MTYKTIGRSVANYGAPVWSTNASATSIGKIQIAQNEAMRIATGSHKMSSIDHLHNETEMLTVKEHSRSFICTIPGSVPGPRSRMPQHHHDGRSTAPDEAYSTHQTLSNNPTAAGCYKEGDAPGCTHRSCHQGYQQPTA